MRCISSDKDLDVDVRPGSVGAGRATCDRKAGIEYPAGVREATERVWASKHIGGLAAAARAKGHHLLGGVPVNMGPVRDNNCGSYGRGCDGRMRRNRGVGRRGRCSRRGRSSHGWDGWSRVGRARWRSPSYNIDPQRDNHSQRDGRRQPEDPPRWRGSGRGRVSRAFCRGSMRGLPTGSGRGAGDGAGAVGEGEPPLSGLDRKTSLASFTRCISEVAAALSAGLSAPKRSGWINRARVRWARFTSSGDELTVTPRMAAASAKSIGAG
jgi:hypothetical protein